MEVKERHKGVEEVRSPWPTLGQAEVSARLVIPAEAGIQESEQIHIDHNWIPIFMGMTNRIVHRLMVDN